MKTILTAPDGLVLRDGKPFGEHGTHAGGFLEWPMPQTLAGMLRTAIGQQRGRDYFTGPEKETNIEEILQLTLRAAFPVAFEASGLPKPLFPTPSDLFFTNSEDKLKMTMASYAPLQESEGTLSPFATPLLTCWETNEKPSSDTPIWLYQDVFMKYVAEDLPGIASPEDLSPGRPITEELQHNAIAVNGTSDDGKLYRTRNLYLDAQHAGIKSKQKTRLGIYLELEHHREADKLPGSAYLGGERRTVCFASEWQEVLPECPAVFAEQRYLKLVLATHGDFGGWAPDWLLKSADGEWALCPGTDFGVRLKTAIIPRWQAVSGWDYAKRGPKAMKKLVPPGSVYLIECKDPAQSQAVAERLWAQSIGDGQSARDGYGLCFVARSANSTKTLFEND